MQKGQWSCQKDVSVRRLLLPQWLIQPLLPTFTRPQERQLSGFLLLLLHRNMLLKHSPAAPLPGRGSCVFSHCGVTRARSQKCAWVLFLRWEQHSTMLPLQPQQLSSCSLAHTPGAVTVSNNSHLSHKDQRLFPEMENKGTRLAPQLRDHRSLWLDQFWTCSLGLAQARFSARVCCRGLFLSKTTT